MSDEVTRTEEWQFDQDGMIATFLVEVLDGERVRVDETLAADELGLEGGTDDVDSWKQKFVKVFPYADVAEVLRKKGGTLVE